MSSAAHWPRPSQCHQTQLLDQPVLQRSEHALDTALCPLAVGAENVDVQFCQCATELCRAVAARGVPGIHPEDAVLVAVGRDRLAMPLETCHASRNRCASRGNNRMPIPTRQIVNASTIGLSRRQRARAGCTSPRDPQTTLVCGGADPRLTAGARSPNGQAGENAMRFPILPTGRRLPTSFTGLHNKTGL